MSEPRHRPAVSRTRKTVSSIILVVVLILLAIEVRAAIGQSNSGKALAAASTDGLFEDKTLLDVQAMLSLSPTSTIIRETTYERVLHYRWFSLFRPLMGQPVPELFLVHSFGEPEKAIAYFTDSQDALSGFYGDPLPAEEPTGYPEPTADNPLGLPEGDVSEPAASEAGNPTPEVPTSTAAPTP